MRGKIVMPDNFNDWIWVLIYRYTKKHKPLKQINITSENNRTLKRNGEQGKINI
jgi:hypothetical protein